MKKEKMFEIIIRLIFALIIFIQGTIVFIILYPKYPCAGRGLTCSFYENLFEMIINLYLLISTIISIYIVLNITWKDNE